MELSELRTKEDVADYLRYLIHALETGEKTPEKVSVGVSAVKALAVELDRCDRKIRISQFRKIRITQG